MMKCCAVLLALAATAHAQERRTFKWALQEGEKRPAKWKLTLKSELVAGAHTESSDITNAFAGTLRVVSIRKDGRAECLLSLNDVDMRIKQGAIDVRVAVSG